MVYYMSSDAPPLKAGDLPRPVRSKEYIDLEGACVVWTEGKNIKVHVYNVVGKREPKVRVFEYIDQLEYFMTRRKCKVLTKPHWVRNAPCRNSRILLDCKIRDHT